MKKFVFMIAMVLGTFAISAQDEGPLYLVFEFMHVDNEQESAYAETEAFWEKVHVQRVKNGDCIGWDLWRLSPGGEKQGSQYLTVSVYNDPVKMMEGGDFAKAWSAAYPELSDEEIAQKFEMTAKSRDLDYRVYLHQIDATEDDFDMPIGTLAVMNFMKVKDGNYDAYEKTESEVFKPMHQKDIEAGGRASWGLLRNMMGYPSEAYTSHIAVDMYTSYEQFFNGGTDDGPELSEEAIKAINDGLATRDLKSMTFATLLRKVR